MSDWRSVPSEKHGLDFDSIRLTAIPADLTGKTVLDIGGYDGKFAKICLDRGAKDAVVVDNKQWSFYGWPTPDFHQGVRYEEFDVFQWTEPADFVICYNVIYHSKSPWELSEHMRKITREQMALCTSFVPGDDPMWRMWGPGDRNWEDKVYWKPTLAGLWKLLESTGWEVEGIGRVGDHVVVRCH